MFTAYPYRKSSLYRKAVRFNMACSNKRSSYKEYLNSPSSKIPRATVSRRRRRGRLGDSQSKDPVVPAPDVFDDKPKEPVEENCHTHNSSVGNLEYIDLFKLEKCEEQVISSTSFPCVYDEEHCIEDICDGVNCVNLENINDEWDNDINLEFDDHAQPFSDKDPISDTSDLTFHDISVLLVTLKITFNLSAIALNFIIKIISLILPENKKQYLRNVNQLYRQFCKHDKLTKHFYCQHCSYYIGSDILSTSCPACERDASSEKYFVELPLETELPKILERTWKHTDHRFHKRGYGSDDTIHDVYDGKLYRQHFGPGGFLEDRNNFSLLGNTDGVAIFKSSSFSVWPVYAVINELPPKHRFRRENKILCGLWFGKSKPNFSTFFKPFTEQLWNLCTEGFTIRVPEKEEIVTCKALLLHMSCDSPAKCMFQDFMQYNAYYGCPYCLNPGQYDKTGHSHVYPYNNDADNGFGEMRTHEGTIALARQARTNLEAGKKKFAEKGVKGVSWAFSMPSFDIINGMCLDYMHAVLLGVMKQLLKKWCNNRDILSKIDYEEVQGRLINFTPPNNITRAPRPLDELKHWKASEYRSFLLFYGPACLYGKLKPLHYDHFMLLSTAIWLLLQIRITANDLQSATRHLQYFSYQMSTLYGSNSMTFSVHLLLHLPHTVKMNGPLWCQSCFFFEDYNSELRQFFHSSQHPDSQVVKAVSVTQCLPVMALQMTKGSEAEHLQRVMKADRYKSKCLTELDKDLFLVGKGAQQQPTDEILAMIHLEHDALFNGPIFIYKRALIKGQMLHSSIYQKVTQRNSYCVEFQYNGQYMYGEIVFYILCNNKGFAFIKKWDEKDIRLTTDDTTGILGQHIVVVDNKKSESVLISTQAILQKVMILKVSKLDFFMIGKFPNFIEKD